MATLKLYNVKMTVNGQDRLLYDTQTARDNNFASRNNIIAEVSSFERKDDLTFNLDIYTVPLLDTYNYGIFIFDKLIRQSALSTIVYWNLQSEDNRATVTNFDDYPAFPSNIDIYEYPDGFAFRVSDGALPESYTYYVIENATIEHKYYLFIQSAIEKNRDTTRLICKLDTITQFMTKDQIDQTKEVYIKRTHLDRFRTEGVDPVTYKYNFENDDLLIKEDFNIEPRVINNTGKRLYEFDGVQDIKWLCITTSDFIQVGKSRFKLDGTEYENNSLAQSGKTYYLPIGTSLIYIVDSTDTLIATTQVSTLLQDMAQNTEIIDVRIVPYICVSQDIEITYPYIPLTNLNIKVKLNFANANLYVDELVTGNTNTNMIYNLSQGETKLLYVDGAQDHSPEFSLSDITTLNREPKLFQFKKYIMSMMQNNADLFFDALQNDALNIYLQRGLPYTLDRFDFFVDSGLYKNAKGTGATLTNISDNTVPIKINQWAEYANQKKVTSSTGFAYGTQIAGGIVGTAVAGITTGGLGAGVSVANNIMALLNTYAQRQDLKRAPDKLKGRGSNVTNDMYADNTFMCSITVAQPLDSEMTIIETFLFQNGYKLGQYKNIYDIIDTRVNFNYIETLTEDYILTVGVSGAIQQDIIGQLNKGVRFYKSLDKLTTKTNINTERSILL